MSPLKYSLFVVMHLSYFHFYCSKHPSGPEKLSFTAFSSFRVWCCSRRLNVVLAWPFCISKIKISYIGLNLVSGGKGMIKRRERILGQELTELFTQTGSSIVMMECLLEHNFFSFNPWANIIYRDDFPIAY